MVLVAVAEASEGIFEYMVYMRVLKIEIRISFYNNNVPKVIMVDNLG